MATNHRNEFCVQCQELTLKGDGSRLQHNGSWRTFCASCAVARQANKNKAVSKAAYIKKQPTLFTEEVNPMKCDKNPLNNLVEMPETPTAEELILWLTSRDHGNYAKGGDRLLKSISNQAKQNGRITPKQQSVVLSFYSQAAAHNNIFVGKTWGHEWQKNICKWCGVDENNLTTIKSEEVITLMTEKQIKFIRDLFKANKEFMTIDEQESLINKMKGHLDGSAVLSIQWGSKAIDKLKSYNTGRSAS
jgi:hypothetical protein